MNFKFHLFSAFAFSILFASSLYFGSITTFSLRRNSKEEGCIFGSITGIQNHSSNDPAWVL